MALVCAGASHGGGAVAPSGNASARVKVARFMREFVSVRMRVARRLEARARFQRFLLRAARVAIVLLLGGEAFMVAAIARVVWRNW